MRSLAVLSALTVPALADDGPMWEAELRVGGGFARSGHATMATNRPAPLTVSAVGSLALQDDPRLYGIGGLVAETLQRSAIGVLGGVRIAIRDTPMRLAAGGTWMFAPDTLWGAFGSFGACTGEAAFAVCGDVQLTGYFAGTGLPNDATEVQVQFVVGFMAREAM